MKNHLFSFLIISYIVSFPFVASGQKLGKHLKEEDRFNAGIVFGTNISQMDGDYFVGYDKWGIVGGIKGIARLTPRLDFNMEFLYSKKGAKIFSGNKRGNDFVKDRVIDLTYVEVPFTLKWLLRNELKSWHIEVGGMYGRIIGNKITERFDEPISKFSYSSIIDDFEKGEISALGGVGFTWNRKWAIHGRFIYGLTRIYENEQPISGSGVPAFSLPVEFLRNYYVSLQVAYTIF